MIQQFVEFVIGVITEGKKLEAMRLECIKAVFDKYYKQHAATFGLSTTFATPTNFVLPCSLPLARRIRYEF